MALLPVILAALITAVQLLVAAIVTAIWREQQSQRARLHKLEGAHAVTDGLVRELLARARRQS